MKRKAGDYTGSIDWCEDRHEKPRSPEDCVPIHVGEEITWADRCRWQASAGRCSMVAGMLDMCGWHYDCILVGGQFAEDYQAYSEWFAEKGYAQGWKQSVNYYFDMVCGRVDPYDDMRFKAASGGGARRHQKRFEGVDIKQTIDTIHVIKKFLENGDKKQASVDMEGLAEKYPGNAAGFLIMGREF